MRIVYTKHAKEKFKSLLELGPRVTKSNIRDALENPDFHGEYIYRGTEFVLKDFDKTHNLCVIFAREDDIIIVIHFTPQRKEGI